MPKTEPLTQEQRLQEIANRYNVIVYFPTTTKHRCATGVVVGWVRHDGYDCTRVAKAANEVNQCQP